MDQIRQNFENAIQQKIKDEEWVFFSSKLIREEFSKKHSFNLYINDTCRIPRIVNKTNKWNEFDRKALERSKKRCIEIYGSCLKTFIKTNEQSYQVICE